jgi:hypothetical protein
MTFVDTLSKLQGRFCYATVLIADSAANQQSIVAEHLASTSAECVSVFARPLIERDGLSSKDAFDRVRDVGKPSLPDRTKDREAGLDQRCGCAPRDLLLAYIFLSDGLRLDRFADGSTDLRGHLGVA